MVIKTNIKFESFNDGILNIFDEDDNGKPINRYSSITFQNRIIGSKRYYLAQQAQIEINKLIRIQKIKGINEHQFVVIGNWKYKIKQIQEINDTNPGTLDLTLQQFEMFGDEYGQY